MHSSHLQASELQDRVVHCSRHFNCEYADQLLGNAMRRLSEPSQYLAGEMGSKSSALRAGCVIVWLDDTSLLSTYFPPLHKLSAKKKSDTEFVQLLRWVGLSGHKGALMLSYVSSCILFCQIDRRQIRVHYSLKRIPTITRHPLSFALLILQSATATFGVL